MTTSRTSNAPLPSRRSTERAALEVGVDFHSEHNFFAGLSTDVSEGGLFVATHELRPVGTLLEVKLSLPGDETPIAAKVEVRWLREYNAASDAPPGMGLKFVDLEGEALVKIQAFVDRVRAPLLWDE